MIRSHRHAAAIFLVLTCLGVPAAHSEEGTASSYVHSVDPLQACQQACSCSCPGGIIIPATPSTPPAAGGLVAAPETGNYHGHHHGGPELPDEPVDYPIPFVDRPLILTNGLTEPELAATFFNTSTVSDADLRERLLLGFQTSFAEHLQAGAALNIAVDPKISLGSAYAIFQYGMNPFSNARIDLGYRGSACSDDTGGGGAFSGGIGLPVKYKFGPHLAAISGRPYNYAFADDLITWDVKGCHTGGTIGLPIGLEGTLSENVNFGLRTGYRRTIGAGAGTGFIPLGFDFIITLQHTADIGLSIELPNALGTPSDLDKTESYAFERRFTLYGLTRL